MNNIKYFRGSFIVTIIGLAIALYLGGVAGLIVAGILGILEVSLSLDNAIVNAVTLNTMSEKWRHRFITWGLLVAVVGMRLLLPLLIVSVVTSISMYESLQLALFKPIEYKHAIESAHVIIMGGGGAFLGMIFLTYFIDESKEVHWIHLIEHPLTYLGKIEAIQAAIVLLASYFVYRILKTLPVDHSTEFIIASVLGVVMYIGTDVIKVLLEFKSNSLTVVKSGIASFIYLEILDASFSFDSTLGAFAITQNILIITIGLGIGSMFVRSLTLLLVDKGTLAEYRYLEHGAFYAIGALFVIMYVNTFAQIPEVVTGLIGAVFIITAFIHSYLCNKADTLIIN